MASRVAEVIYKLKDLFSGPTKKVEAGYARIRKSSKNTADSVNRDSSRIAKGFAGVQGGITSLIGGWRGLAAAVSGGAVVGGFKSVIDQADQVGKAAQKINLTSEALSKLAFAAERSNVGFNSLEIGLQRMERRIGDALNGSTELQKTFGKLGLDVQELSQLQADEAFLRIADAVKVAGSETEQLSLFIKIFDSEAANLIRVAKLGSEGIRELGDEAERLGRVFGADFTEKAAKFNDTLTDIGARLTGVKINTFTPILEELVDFFDNVGLGDKVTGLTTELLLLEQQLAKPLVFNRKGVERQAESIRNQLILINRAREQSTKTAEAERKALADNKKANTEYAQSLATLSNAYKTSADARRSALAKETAELRTARAEQKSIEQEFQNLVDDITKPEKEDVSLGDVFGANTQARAALAKGETDEAIRLARDGGDLLGQLKEKGTETSGTLKFLAEQLRGVAKEAAAQKTQAELVDVEKAQNDFNQIAERAKILTATAPAAGSEYARAFLAAMSAEFAATTIPAPAVAAPQVPAVESSSNIRRNGNSFSDGTDYRREIDKRGPK